MEKIVITGMGAVTPVGIGVDNYWNSIIEGKCGIDKIQSFDVSELAVQIAGEIKDFNPSDYLPKDVVRKTDAFMQYAYIAAEEALAQSGLEIGSRANRNCYGNRDERNLDNRVYSGSADRSFSQKGRTSLYS